ncbi:MAG: hypothetical protein RR619_11715, partial [Raoultibacter sp.]
TELLLARSDHGSRRYYSMTNQILATHEEYYRVLEQTQECSEDVTQWLEWFFKTLQAALEKSDNAIQFTLERATFWKSIESVSLNERQRSVLNRLKNDFEGKLTASKRAKLCKTSRDTTLRDIKDLLDKNVLVQDKSGGRSTSYHLANLESEQTRAGI